MKVLTPLIVLLALSSSSTFAKEDIKQLDDYISENKKEQFEYDYEKIEADSSKLRDSWIAPLRLNYSYSKSNPYDNTQTKENGSLKMDQPIFQSGGIYYGIKFAEASRIYSNYSVDVAKRKIVKDTISLLMQIKQIDLKIQKQKFRIKNSEISLEQKKEQYLNGQLDSGFLDNAIIERNFVIQALYDIQTNKERLISRFQALSDMNYRYATIPHLKILNKEQFLKYNIVLMMSESEIEKNRYNKNVTIAKYLPRVSLTAGYNWQSSSVMGTSFVTPETDFYDYGIKAYMPLDINTFRDIESSKVDFLKSKVVKDDKLVQLNAIFEQVMQNVDNFEKKKLLTIDNKNLYKKLLADTKTLYKIGHKTNYDVDLLSNSVTIEEIDFKIFEIDKQLELLTLYEMYKND
ncbi:MAG: TolC family protein [Campylobacterota bacterium]|nr:TolC family protein [Campylobacterota bacterium]